MPKFRVRRCQPFNRPMWIIFAPDGWAERSAATFAEAMDYVSQQAKERYSA